MRRSGVQIPEAALSRNPLRCNRLRRFATTVKRPDSQVSKPKCPGNAPECRRIGSTYAQNA
jgi:hypothetical protein